MRRVILAFVALILLVGIAGAQEKATEDKGQFKIAVVNLRKVVDNYKKAQEEYRKILDSRKMGEEELKKLQDQIEMLSKELDEKGDILAEDVRKAKEEELANLRQQAQDKARSIYNEFAQEKDQLTKDVVAQIYKVVSELAKEKGFALVLDKATILYADEALDISDLLIERLNAEEEATKAEE